MLSLLQALTFFFSLDSFSFAIPLANQRPTLNEKRSPQNVYPQGASDAVVLDLPSATAVPPPTASGGLYGNEGLLGPDGNPVKGSAIVKDYQLVPGQLENPDEGLEVFYRVPTFV